MDQHKKDDGQVCIVKEECESGVCINGICQRAFLSWDAVVIIIIIIILSVLFLVALIYVLHAERATKYSDHFELTQ